MCIQVWLGAMISWMIGIHDQLGGSPSHKTLLPTKHSMQFGEWLTFFVYRIILMLYTRQCIFSSLAVGQMVSIESQWCGTSKHLWWSNPLPQSSCHLAF
jgi:hypothetical protein